MKFALVNGYKQEPRPGVNGICPFCGARVISKCGNILVWHWAHYSKYDCDIWWENETQWHRNWKGCFPKDWQEIIHTAENGEKHYADVKTNDGCAIEFQHSFISTKERLSRNNFYPNLVWVVDGLRRKRDKDQFFKAIELGARIMARPLIIKSPSSKSKLIKEWQNSSAPVFFDFGEEEIIWWLLPFKDNGHSYVVQFSRQAFIDLQRGRNKVIFYNLLKSFIRDFCSRFQNKGRAHLIQKKMPVYNVRSYQPRSFEQRLARRRKRRRL